MKWVFFGTLILAITLSVIANVTKPKDGNKGVVATLVWATDGNPARQEQMQLFREWHLKHYGQPIDIKIDPTNSGADKVIIQSISGAGPDLFDYNGRANLERYVKSGVILDVTERAKEKGFPQELVWAGLRPSLVYDGRQYAFTDNAANYLILYHKDVFDRFHVPYPKPGWTWYDFLKIAQKFSFKERNGMRHFALPSYDPIIMMYSNGARMFTPGGTECIINSPEGIEAMQFYRDLQVKYHVMPTASEMADQTSAGGWGSGDINVFGNKGEKFFAMAYGGRYWFVQFAKMSREEGSDASPLFNIGCVKPPIFKYDYESGSARCTGVNRNSKQKEYAMRFLEFLASSEFNRQINRSYDALSGVKKYCEAPWTISDNQPAPKGLECVNDPQWVDAMNYDYEVDKSPFIPPYRVSTIWGEEKGVLDAGNSREVKPVLDSYVRRVNEEIQRNAYADPKLKALYEKAKREDELWKKSNGGTR